MKSSLLRPNKILHFLTASKTWNYLSFFNNTPPASWVLHITRNFLIYYLCSYYSSMSSHNKKVYSSQKHQKLTCRTARCSWNCCHQVWQTKVSCMQSQKCDSLIIFLEIFKDLKAIACSLFQLSIETYTKKKERKETGIYRSFHDFDGNYLKSPNQVGLKNTA